LFLLAQLAIFNIFIGGTDRLDQDMGYLLFTNVGEWGGLITYGTKNLQLYPWLIVFPGLFVTVTVFILSFFARQLEQRFQNPNLFMQRPFYKNKTLLGTTAALSICAIVLVSTIPDKSPAADVSINLLSPQKQQQITNFSKQVMTYVETGNMRALRAYLDIRMELNGTDEPIKVFQEWNQKIKNGYRFGEIGTINKADQTYEVELNVTNPSGTSEKWYLGLTAFGGSPRISYAK
jgi:hypothetical protein